MADAPRALDPDVFGPDQLCFGCGPKNPAGLRLTFTVDGDSVVTRYTPRPHQEGPPGIFHGGLQATLVDDLAGWTLVGLRDRMGFTQSMNIRYLRPMRLGVEIVGRGRITKEVDRMAVVEAELEQNGERGCSARIVYALPDEEGAKKVLGMDLAPELLRFCR